MRESRLSGSVEGVMSDHDSYSDFESAQPAMLRGASRTKQFRFIFLVLSMVSCRLEPEQMLSLCWITQGHGELRLPGTFTAARLSSCLECSASHFGQTSDVEKFDENKPAR